LMRTAIVLFTPAFLLVIRGAVSRPGLQSGRSRGLGCHPIGPSTGGVPGTPNGGHGQETSLSGVIVAHNVAVIGVIGGSGFYTFFGADARSVVVDTPYGQPSAPITVGRVGCHEVAFLPRHGLSHEYSPHTVPYRANMWALRALGVRRVFGPCAVGSLSAELGAGSIVIPDQLVDRTRGRADTYFDSGGIHVEFAAPYCPNLRAVAPQAPGVIDGGTMVVIQGPRFSTRAESQWFARQGFTLVNMTGYPEAVLARELEMCYAAIALVTDVDAGLAHGAGVRAVDVFAEFERNIGPFKELVHGAIDRTASERVCTHCLSHEGVELPFDLP
jgi:5'-methylthioadenosine phosphorylase